MLATVSIIDSRAILKGGHRILHIRHILDRVLGCIHVLVAYQRILTALDISEPHVQ